VAKAYSAANVETAAHRYDDGGHDVSWKHEGMEDLGRRLKEVRIRAGLTLRELARQADVSPSLISQIENGKSQPSVATLYAFSRLLNVSVDELFDERGTAGNGTGAHADQDLHPSDPTNAWQPSEYANRISVVHPSHRPHLDMAEGVVWERLAATPEHGVNFMKITYAPGAASADGDLITHDGYEYGYVLSGEVAVTVGDEVFNLHPGESVGFDSSIPHVLRNPGATPFEGIWFVHGQRH
jgi:transcriptional regulator with XRE-family HTH domain